jgi:hypothetical protein
MNFRRISASLVLLVFVSVPVFNGCKSGTPQAGNQPNNAPDAQAQQAAGGAQPSSASGAATGSSQPGSQAPQTPPPPAVVNLPAGTHLRVRLDQDLGSRISHTGDAFSATLADDVLVNGQTVIPKGARADGSVIDAKPLGHIKGGAVLQIRLDRVTTNWGSYPVATSSIDRAEKGKGKRTAEFAGGGGAFGAIIGGLAGGKKGALIGGLAGAGAGTAGSAMTGNKEIVLPAETLLTFKLESPVHITEK